MALTSLVAGIATGPFAVYHFNRIADYGLLATSARCRSPASGSCPGALSRWSSCRLGSRGSRSRPWGWGIDAVVWIASGVAAQPGAVTLVPAMPAAALLAIVIGGLWLCLWRSRWRFLGIAVIGGGMLVAGLDQRPDILIDGEAKVMAVRGEDGKLWCLHPSARALRERRLAQAGRGKRSR